MSSTIVLLILAASLHLGAPEECPGIGQCIFTHPRCFISGIRSNFCLDSIIGRLHYSGKTSLILDKLSLPDGLPPGALVGPSISSVTFMGYDLPKLSKTGESPFQDATNIKRLYFVQPASHMRNWDYKPLAALQLTELTFSSCPIEYFADGGKLPQKFKDAGTDSIRQLEISGSCLTELEPGSLSTFRNVETIRLAGNYLNRTPRNVFPDDPKNLKSIDLRGNRIVTITSNEMFWNPNLPTLVEVFLQDNKIEEIIYTEFPAQIRKFYLNGNPLNCNSGIEFLLKVDESRWSAPNESRVACRKPVLKLKNCPLANLIGYEPVDKLKSCPEAKPANKNLN